MITLSATHKNKIQGVRPNYLVAWSFVVCVVVGGMFFLFFVAGSTGGRTVVGGESTVAYAYDNVGDFVSQQGNVVSRAIGVDREHEYGASDAAQEAECGRSFFLQCNTTSNSVLNVLVNKRKTLLRTIRSEPMSTVPVVYPTGEDKRLFVYGSPSLSFYSDPSLTRETIPFLFTYLPERTQPEIDVTVNTKNVMITPDNTVVVSFYFTVKPIQEEIYIQPQSQKITNISFATQDVDVEYDSTFISGLQQETKDGALVFPEGRSQVLFVSAVMKDFETGGLYEFSFDSLAYEDRYGNVFHHSIPDTSVRGVERHSDGTLRFVE